MIDFQKKNNIAIVGTGVAGLTAAHLLHPQHSITLYEAETRVGGHINTVMATVPSGLYAVDTGFIVFNYATYPNFTRLLKKLNVATKPSEMSFSFSSDQLNLEYSGRSINSLFAQRRNLGRAKFYRLLADIVRFNHQAKQFLQSPTSMTLGGLTAKKHYSRWFYDSYLYPLAAAIWSAPPDSVSAMPAEFILNFYRHHGLLNLIERPQWYVVEGGSKCYVEALTKPFYQQIRLNQTVKMINRDHDKVVIQTAEDEQSFDAVVLACHSDQALKLLAEPSSAEREILSAIPYQENCVTLHYDDSVLPRQQQAWASWNYRHLTHQRASLTYYMNRLQSIEAPEHFCVSVNQPGIAEDKIINRFVYSHPLYNQESVKAKQSHAIINGQQRTFYAGAYWGNGFHEDGVVSSLQALAKLGLAL